MRAAILSGILFLSGASALLFETLWLRLSGLTFGNSVWAAALILSSFMGGLALGTAIAANLRVRRRPLHVYAALEVFVAIFGCAIVFALPVIGQWLRPLFQTLWNHHPILNALRFSLSFLILLAPTTAMGLTLPVLIDDPVLRRQEFGQAIGILYGFNTLGAVVGALAGEGVLVRAFGLHGTALFAGLINCAAALLALIVARSERLPVESDLPRRKRWKIDYSVPWTLLFASLGGGAILLCLEVAWFRFLRLYVASSSTAFSIMLAVVLAGIGFGGVASALLHRWISRLSQTLPLLFLGAALATLLSYLFFPIPVLQKSAGSAWQDFYFDSWREIAVLALALMFPVAFLSGILFPAIVARVQKRVENRMNTVGITTLFNTTGAAIGPLLASFVLLPRIGFQTTLIVCATAYAVLAILVIDRQSWSLRKASAVVVLAVAGAFILVLAFFPHRRVEEHFAHAREPYARDGSHLIRKIEGTADTLQLLRRDFLGEPYYHRLITNAFTMSDTRWRNQRYMRMFAYLPLALCPNSKEALLICYGCGVTADALCHDARLKHIDIVDISREVLALAGDYSTYPNPLQDARVNTFVQDGRFFLQASPKTYDLITGEPPPPKVAGSVNLYTQEFFSLMQARLNDGGIATFWLPIYQMKVEEAKAILHAFHNAFPEAAVFANADEEWIMMGIKGSPRKVDQQSFLQLWQDESTRTDLARIGMENPKQLGAMFLMDGAEIDRITRDTKPLTDSFPKRLSDAAPERDRIHQFAWNYMEARSAARAFRSSSLIDQLWPAEVARAPEPFLVVRETRYRSEIEPGNRLAELDLYLRHSRLRAPVLEVLETDEFRVAIAERIAAKSVTPPIEALPDLAAGALARRNFGDAISFLETKENTGVFAANEFFLLTYLYCLNGNVEKAEALAAAGDRSLKKDAFVTWLWGKLQAEFGFRPPS